MNKRFRIMAICLILILTSAGLHDLQAMASIGPDSPVRTEPPPSPTPFYALPLVTKNFATGEFVSEFNGPDAKWEPVSGNWDVENGNYTSPGLPGKWVSTSIKLLHYSNLDYQAELKRTGCQECAYGLIVRGQPEPLGDANRWSQGYGFYISYDGYFGVFKYIDGKSAPLKDWIQSGEIHQGEGIANTLRVKADREQLAFLINDILVWEEKDSTFTDGKVGILMYTKTGSTGDQIRVEWAKLTLNFQP